jgi:Uma2 family endonuclease
MNLVLREPWTVERFLSWEDAQEGKHEFGGTQITAMTGGSRAHQRIVFNLTRLLTDRLDPERFDAVQEMRVEVAGKVRYPDVTICAGPIPDGVWTLRDAVMIVEVLSDETAVTDREAKRIEYTALPGMCYYLLLEQIRMAATVLELRAGGWHETQVTGGRVALSGLGIELALDDIYRGVRLPSSSST